MVNVQVAPAAPLPAYAGWIFRWKFPTLVVVAISLWITLTELDRLIEGAAPQDGGAGRSAAGLQGLEAYARRDSWDIWAQLHPAAVPEVGWLLIMYAAVDLLFALSYFLLLLGIFRGRKWLTRLVIFEFACEAVESVFMAFSAGHPGVPFLNAPLWLAAYAKWAALLAVLLFALADGVLRRRLLRRLKGVQRALLFHRLNLAAVAGIAAMALLPIPGVSDQLPDAQRSWAAQGLGEAHWWWAWATVLAGTAGLFVLGRRRSELAWALFAKSAPKKAPSVWWWAYGPMLLVAGLSVAALTQQLPEPPGVGMLVVVGIPIAVVLASWLIKAVSPSVEPTPRTRDRGRAVAVWRCGDALACLFLVVSGMALIRSFSAPVALAAVSGWHRDWGWPAVFLGLGWLAVLLGFFAVTRLLRWTWTSTSTGALAGLLDPRVASGTLSKNASWASLAVSCLVLGLYEAVPDWAARTLGVPATAVLSVLAWTIAIGFLVVQLQEQRAMPVFEKFGLRANPIVTLILLTLVITSINGGDSRVHAIRQSSPTSANEKRLKLDEYFRRWTASNGGCAISVPGTAAKVRPVIFVAAEGGGIRAAVWIASAFTELASHRCGSTSVVLSSGVSGGSLGLVVAQRYGEEAKRTRVTPLALVTRMAAPDALAVGVAGALTRDMVAAGTGLLVAANDQNGWQDRAALMERAWESAARKLAEPWRPADSHTGPTGALILNSTASGIGCRLLISQIDLDGSSAARTGVAKDASCRHGGTPLSIDLMSQDACPLAVSWSTAAMISARFPLISPAGRVPYRTESGCSPDNSYQAIDGGYSEGSGLGTVNDVWPLFQEEIRQHNLTVGDGGTYFAPVFLYVRNSRGADVLAAPPKAAGELAVPLLGISAKNLQSDASSWLQRLASDDDVCGSASGDCAVASNELKSRLGGQSTVVLAPDSHPAIDPPLGWALSQLSQDELSRAMDTATCRNEGAGEDCSEFARLLHVLDRGSPAAVPGG
ncbi:hypothetical protein [Pseudarthrobacter albicanus]|uniref:hypothetical protein n=1 Tax=Pseudarthrobacter albicanus TaxID=2823873 RepID=UPI001BA77C46|nr:hypothetical protein [Pseudarthrobacter albicanus]